MALRSTRPVSEGWPNLTISLAGKTFWLKTVMRLPNHVSHPWRCAQPPQQRRPPSTSHFFSSTRPKIRIVRRHRLHTSRTPAASGTCLLPLPAEGSSRQSQENIGRSIQVVFKVVSAPARFWDRGARRFVVRLRVLEQLDETAAGFGGSMIRDSKAFRRAVRAKYLCRMYSGQFAGSLKLGRL